MEGPILWDTLNLSYVGAVNGPALPDLLFGNGAANTNTGHFTLLWYNFNGVSTTLPDNSLICTLALKVKTGTPGFYPVKMIHSFDPAYYEMENAGNTAIPLNQIVGGVVINAPDPGDLNPVFCITSPGCTNSTGTISSQISGGMPGYTYNWTGPNGFSSGEPSVVGAAPGSYQVTITDAVGHIVRSEVDVPYANQIPFQITVDSIVPASCGMANGCISLSTEFGAAPYQFTWSDNGPSVPNRCNLLPGNYQLTITDASGCAVPVSFTIHNDTALTVQCTTQFADCRFGEKGTSLATASKGVAPYTYQWSNGFSGPGTSNLTKGWYTVTVTDATGCKQSTSTEVKDYGVFDWYVHLNNLTTTNSDFKAQLIAFDFESRAEYPLRLTWNTGTIQEIPVYQSDTLTTVSGLIPGVYRVTLTDAQGCSVENQIKNDRLMFDFFNEYTNQNPRFFIRDDNALNSYGPDSCVTVYGQFLNNVTGIHFSLSWSNAQFATVKEIASPWFTPDNFTIHPLDNKLDFHWKSTSGTAPDSYYGYPMFKVCFIGDAGIDQTEIEFSKNADPPAVIRAPDGDMGFLGKSGKVAFHSPYWSSISDNPIYKDVLWLNDCVRDGYSSLLFCDFNYSIPTHGSIEVNHNGHTYFNTIEPLLFISDTGMYHVHYADNSGDGYLLARIPPKTQNQPECVWEGDADNNEVVNHHDLLYVGLGQGSTGPLRPSGALNPWDWYGLPGQDWSQFTPHRLVNFKNMDTDGDGSITQTDVSPIMQNWGNMIHSTTEVYAKMPPVTQKSNLPVYVKTDTVFTGAPVSVPVMVGTSSFPADSLHGISFSISYDPVLLKDSLYFEPAAS
jgi:hypothetical protein